MLGHHFTDVVQRRSGSSAIRTDMQPAMHLGAVKMGLQRLCEQIQSGPGDGRDPHPVNLPVFQILDVRFSVAQVNLVVDTNLRHFIGTDFIQYLVYLLHVRMPFRVVRIDNMQ